MQQPGVVGVAQGRCHLGDVLDEPLGPLDSELRADLLAMLARLHEEQGWTTVHVTHDPEEAGGYAARVLRMEDGRLVERAGARTEAIG